MSSGARWGFAVGTAVAALVGVVVATRTGAPPTSSPATPPTAAPPGGTAVEPASPSPIPGLSVNVLECARVADSLVTTASIRNDGQEDVRYVDVSLSWSDAQGNVVATDIRAIVGGETIMAGDSTVFTAGTANELATDCAASVFFYEPIP